MQSSATSVADYIASLSAERQEVINNLRKVIKENLPEGFEEGMSYGMIGYYVPHSLYPDGYHCKPKDPLPFINLASQKNFIALYHMGLYAKKELLDWFVEEYPKHCNRKLDMGKSCIRFKKLEDIPYDLIGELVSKMSPQEWISVYERNIKK
ncbi:DUF1801 domain-containing protein [Salinimicrobium soli]|uniref:DUF1801 domain-containing protein n=1 Tax=Salinimicrobium soli TaxID=1254399 RepID=UPI003AB04AC7